MAQQNLEHIRHNVMAHDAVALRYERRHGEIFNPHEQLRLNQALTRAWASIQTHSVPLKALDGGCGSGNLTAHLLQLGFHVTAADVSPKFLELITKKFAQTNNLSTLLLNGKDLSNVADNTFDLAAVYSVLHHVPDYLTLIEEMIRVVKPGGIIVLDHERATTFWKPTSTYQQFLRVGAAPRRRDWREYFVPQNYLNKIHKLVNPRFEPEGDIHVFADDHIEWSKIEALFKKHDCEIVESTDYLLFEAGMDETTHNRFQSQCADMHVLMARKTNTSRK